MVVDVLMQLTVESRQYSVQFFVENCLDSYTKVEVAEIFIFIAIKDY